ncbi:APC family permease [Fundicoccus culcitae]|uniref:APC family permease n=1 Tax=Fundicoccus culcitae TaxID=2969821 RepID=A0ABY5P487_9LACT|nr:amino acid permease [Fundicoccus culcitae]UUX33499.1 APC family permease [Fundicoccus culcitae]
MSETTENVTINTESTKFNLREAILYGINVVLGAGILLLPKIIYRDLGPASILAMIFSAFLVFLLALCFAEVAGYVSENGGAYTYAKVAYGEKTAFVIGILSWFTVTAVWSASASGLGEILGATFPIFAGYEMIIAALVIIFFMFMNLGGLKVIKGFSNVVTISKVVPFIFVGIMGLFFIKGGIDAGNWTPFIQISEDTTFSSALASTAMTVFYTFVGFETLPIIGGEVEDSKRNMPKAVLISLTIVTIMYVLLIAAAITMLGPDILATNTPIQDAFAAMVGSWGFWFVSIAAIISLIGLNVGDSTHSPRLLESIAEDGLLPESVSKRNESGTPVASIILTSVVALILVLSGSFETLVDLSVVFNFFAFIPTALAVIVLRRKSARGELAEKYSNEGQFRVPGGYTIPILAIIVSFWMILSDSLLHLRTALIGIVISLIIYYLFNINKMKKT